MPKLTVDLRRMRVRVLHEGYNPVPEETDKQGKGAQFTMTIPKNADDGKRRYEIS